MMLESKKNLSKSEKEVMEESKELDSVGRIMSLVENVGLAGLGGAEAMKQKLEDYDKIRAVILDYIDRNLVKDVDYGWTDPRSMNKHTLRKPGAEKVCRMFNTHPRWIRDYDTWEMVGKPSGVIFLICQIVDNDTGKVIGEGRGAATIGDKSRDANKTIKNAEKCSLVDSALYTFMLSEKFTQDEGGAGPAALNVMKEGLINDISTARAGTKSDISDHKWTVTVLKDFLHKSRIDTVGEMSEFRKAIFENNLYDLSTGIRIN